MKNSCIVLLALASPTCCLGANSAFYVVDVRANNDALLHGMHRKFDQTQKLPLAVLGSKESTCCFVFGAQSKVKGSPELVVNDEGPALTSSRGDEAHQFLGAYRPVTAEKASNKLGFGFDGMNRARLIGNRAM